MRRTRGIPALIIAVATAMMLPFAHVTLSQGHSISGRILVDGRRHNYGVIVWIDTQHMTLTDSLGDYEIGGLGDGEHVVRAWSKYCPARVIDSVQVAGTDISGANGILVAGDLIEDGIINLFDAGEILASYGATPDSAGWDGVLDLSGNGTIDSLDIDVLSAHWKERSDSPRPLTNVEVIRPGEYTAWLINQQDAEIVWNYGFLAGDVTITLHRGEHFDVVDTIAVSTENDGACAYRVPSDIEAGSDYCVRVFFDEQHSDYGDQFTLRQKLIISLTGESFYVGQQDVPIYCRIIGCDFVTIALYKGSTPVDTVYSGILGDYFYSESYMFYYDIPIDLIPGSDYLIEAYIDEYFNDSSGYFEIFPSPGVGIIEPDSSVPTTECSSTTVITTRI